MRKMKLTVLAAILSSAALSGPAMAQVVPAGVAYIKIYYANGSEVGREVFYCEGDFTMTGVATNNFRYYNGFCP